MLGLCPELQADLEAFTRLIATRRPVDPMLLELCRIRVAQILGCAGEADRSVFAALPATRIGALDDWQRSDAFSAVERACLTFAENFVLDPHAISDADAAAVTARLSPAEMVAFVEALALFDGFTRLRLILAVEADDERPS